jgi:hypothetical protein
VNIQSKKQPALPGLLGDLPGRQRFEQFAKIASIAKMED